MGNFFLFLILSIALCVDHIKCRSLTMEDILSEQHAFAIEFNRRLQESQSRNAILLQSIRMQHGQFQENLNSYSAALQKDMNELLMKPVNYANLYVEKEVQDQQLATEEHYMTLLANIQKALIANRQTCGKNGINLQETDNKNIFLMLSYLANFKPKFTSEIHTCEAVRRFPADCSMVQPRRSGIKQLRIKSELYEVLCDNDDLGGGWTMILKRFNGLEAFHNRAPAELVQGFGCLCREFFIGMRKLHRLLTTNKFVLRIEMIAYDGQTAAANYDYLELESIKWTNETTYHLKELGTYSGDAGDALREAIGTDFMGGLEQSNIFGKYVSGGEDANPNNMMWSTFSSKALKAIQVMIRPRSLGVPN